MSLTSEQIQILRESTKDEVAFQRVMTVFEESRHSQETDQHEVFEPALKQVKQLSTLLNMLPVAIYIKDIQGRFIMANPLTLEIMGVDDPNEILGKTDYDLMPTERAQAYHDKEQQILREGKAFSDHEIVIPFPDSEPRWYLSSKSPIYDNQGQCIGLIGINRDITRQKLAEKSLKEEHNLLQTLIDHIKDKVYVKDRESRFVIANRETIQSQRLQSNEQLVGTTDFDYMPHDRAQEMLEEEQHIMETGIPILDKELHTPAEVTRGVDQWYLVSKVPILDEEGNAIGLVGVNRNITNRKLAEQRQIELKLERERSQILTGFIQDTSHEFKTPLSVIQTSAFLLYKSDDPQKQEDYYKQILNQTYRIDDLINSLMIMARLDSMQSLETQSFNLRVFLQYMTEMVQPKVEDKQQTLELVIPEERHMIRANEEFLGYAVYEIMDNAIRFTPEFGQIVIKCEVNSDDVTIAIQDNGIGIDAETQSHIFKHFYRKDTSHTTVGMGLGLSIAKRIMDLHGGTISIASEVDQGTTFILRLPQAIVANSQDITT